MLLLLVRFFLFPSAPKRGLPPIIAFDGLWDPTRWQGSLSVGRPAGKEKDSRQLLLGRFAGALRWGELARGTPGPTQASRPLLASPRDLWKHADTCSMIICNFEWLCAKKHSHLEVPVYQRDDSKTQVCPTPCVNTVSASNSSWAAILLQYSLYTPVHRHTHTEESLFKYNSIKY